ncbi:MAG TPA: hypothetical protein VJY33_23995 [Isosphaeraceae bacterium]|nr:hypothetical protein [Isosphaeraceae bacterium]
MSAKQWSKAWKGSLIALIVSSAGIVSAEGVRHYRVKPKQLCGIPPADYQPPQPPPAVVPVVAVSAVGHVLTPPVNPLTGTAAMNLQIPGAVANPSPRIKVFQFVPSALQIDHCSISRIAFSLQDNGQWRLSLQADQNPVVENSTALTTVLPSTTTSPDFPSTGKPALATAPIRGLPAVRLKHTTFLKRNLFVVQIRGLGDFAEQISVPASPPQLGKPVLVAMEPISFWVQNGVPYPLVSEGVVADASRFFDMIDRVELEFSYR